MCDIGLLSWIVCMLREKYIVECDSGLLSWMACMLREISSWVLLYKSIR